MEALHKERWYALVMGVTHVENFAAKYNAIIEQLTELEHKYRLTNPTFIMDDMWTCNNIRGHIKFSITRQCEDMGLKIKLLEIFDGMLE
jgi:hypothetical protein